MLARRTITIIRLSILMAPLYSLPPICQQKSGNVCVVKFVNVTLSR